MVMDNLQIIPIQPYPPSTDNSTSTRTKYDPHSLHYELQKQVLAQYNQRKLTTKDKKLTSPNPLTKEKQKKNTTTKQSRKEKPTSKQTFEVRQQQKCSSDRKLCLPHFLKSRHKFSFFLQNRSWQSKTGRKTAILLHMEIFGGTYMRCR